MIKMKKLDINGGTKLRIDPFPAYNTIGKEEEESVLRVLRSGKLSTYLGDWHDDFYGGVEVQALEKEWAKLPQKVRRPLEIFQLYFQKF